MKKKKLLIIEDTSICLEMFDYILNRNRIDVTTAKDGEEGVRKAASLRPDLIFLDIMLPKMNGYDVAKAIRKDPNLASTPIVALSARAGTDGEKKALEAGCQEFIYKPFKVPQIQDVLSRFLG
ncbi:MAG TPA: response regulator [Nitrospiria bacterium]|nr:response regulator [Nitrospiria bacterium]